MIQLATSADLDEIMSIVTEARELMQGFNNHQWDNSYPNIDDFRNDILTASLFTEKIDDIIGGFICINNTEPDEYASLKWSSNEKAYVIHRMAVNQKMLNRGIATRLISFAEDYSRKDNVFYIKSDTYMLNIKMLNLFNKLSYTYIGNVDFGKDNFFCCYEKYL